MSSFHLPQIASPRSNNPLLRSSSDLSIHEVSSSVRMMLEQQQQHAKNEACSATGAPPAAAATASSAAAVAAAAHPFSYGDVLGGSLHFLLESLVARTRCERIAAFLPHPQHNVLSRAVIVGPTAPPIAAQNQARIFSGRGDVPGAAGPVTAAVLTTGVAANLSCLAAEDAQDCPGSSVAKNALVVPIRPLRGGGGGGHAAIGVLFAVNKLGGSAVFTNEDQLVLVSVAPSIAYLAETYPLDFSAHRFDPAPLRKVVPMQIERFLNSDSARASRGGDSTGRSGINGAGNKSRALGTMKSKKRKSASEDDADAEVRAAALRVLPEKPVQLVYEQHKEDALLPYVNLSLQQLAQTDKNGASSPLGGKKGASEQQQQQPASPPPPTLAQQAEALSTAEQILSVGQFVERMEACWRDAVSRCIATERELTLRNAMVTDAHAILHRKQRRVEVLKEVLVESLEARRSAPVPAMIATTGSRTGGE